MTAQSTKYYADFRIAVDETRRLGYPVDDIVPVAEPLLTAENGARIGPTISAYITQLGLTPQEFAKTCANTHWAFRDIVEKVTGHPVFSRLAT